MKMDDYAREQCNRSLEQIQEELSEVREALAGGTSSEVLGYMGTVSVRLQLLTKLLANVAFRQLQDDLNGDEAKQETGDLLTKLLQQYGAGVNSTGSHVTVPNCQDPNCTNPDCAQAVRAPGMYL
jgi:hypothetical protein